MIEVDCPNAEICNGVLTFRIYQDGDGDGVYTRTWTDAECTGMTCECDYEPETWERLTKEALEVGENQEPIVD